MPSMAPNENFPSQPITPTATARATANANTLAIPPFPTTILPELAAVLLAAAVAALVDEPVAPVEAGLVLVVIVRVGVDEVPVAVVVVLVVELDVGGGAVELREAKEN
jgi:hypothetical protein